MTTGKAQPWVRQCQQVICITAMMSDAGIAKASPGASALARKPRVTVRCPRGDPDEKLALTEVSAGLRITRSTAASEELAVQTARCEHLQPRNGQ
jgi:hypothetical protein